MVCLFKIDNKLFQPQSMYSYPFFEAEGFIAQLQHESFPFISKQLTLTDAILVLLAKPKDGFPEIYNEMVKKAKEFPTGEPPNFMYDNKTWKIKERKKIFFDHEDHIAYINYLDELFKPYSDYLDKVFK